MRAGPSEDEGVAKRIVPKGGLTRLGEHKGGSGSAAAVATAAPEEEQLARDPKTSLPFQEGEVVWYRGWAELSTTDATEDRERGGEGSSQRQHSVVARRLCIQPHVRPCTVLILFFCQSAGYGSPPFAAMEAVK